LERRREMIRMNKVGTAAGKGILWFVFFLMAMIISLGLVGGVFSFFGEGYDIRNDESEVLLEKVLECFDKNDFFDENYGEEEFYENCRMNKKVLSKEHVVFVSDSEGKEFFVGVYDFKNRCFFGLEKKNKDLPRCFDRKIVKGGEEFYVLVGSNQNSAKI
jgi:hypothetical protein